MKQFILFISLIVSTVAGAAEVKVLEVEVANGFAYVASKFAVNAETGRAWINVKVDGASGDESGMDEYRAKVSGLRFDAATSTIVYEAAGKSVTCATVYESGRFFRKTVVKATGACELSSQVARVAVDDGFEYRTELHAQVFLTVE